MSEPSIYAKAIEIINTRGWCKGAFVEKGTGACCLVGAIRIAAGEYTMIGNDDYVINRYSLTRTGDLAIEHLARMVNDSVAEYNDKHTKEDVIALLQKADSVGKI